jgi:hypothetical protein
MSIDAPSLSRIGDRHVLRGSYAKLGFLAFFFRQRDNATLERVPRRRNREGIPKRGES